VKEIQRHPGGTLVHTDLYEVDVNAKLKLRVPLHFIGRAAGVELGGILQPIRREVEVPACRPRFPIHRSRCQLGIHDALHLSDSARPGGSGVVIDTDEAVVTVPPPVVEEVKVAAEGEVAAEGAAAPAEGAAAKPEAAKPTA
jgi:large subunit ribosomal protein L25